MPDHLSGVVQEQFAQVAARYHGLVLTRVGEMHFLRGPLEFHAEYEGKEVRDTFEVEISILQDYPDSIPLTWETGGRIPPEYHKLGGGALCFAAPFEVRRRFAARPTLHGYIQDLLVPYLFAFSYKERYGTMPFGELAHGGEGILQYYCELLGVSEIPALRLLASLAQGGKSPKRCPCGSGRRLRDCHGPILQQIGAIHERNMLMREYDLCTNHMQKVIRLLDCIRLQAR